MSVDRSRRPLTQRILETHFPESQDELVIGGYGAEELARRFQTPLYVFSADVLRRRLERVRTAVGPEVQVLFALKANPNAAVARLLRRGGAGAEVASAGEIHVALRAGFTGESVQFAGPGKHGEDLRLAVRHGITVNVECLGELEALSAQAAEAGRPTPMCVRVNPPESKTGARMRMSGGSAKFGVDMDELPAIALRAEADPHLELRGLHTYAGTQTFDHSAWLAQAEDLLECARRLESRLNRNLDTINFGGGFGVPVFQNDPDFDLEAAGAGLQTLISRETAQRRYFVELGRYLTAEAGVFLSRVIYTKEIRGQRHAILDGGMNHHAAAAGLGTVIRRSFPVVKANDLNGPAGDGCHLGGPLCTPADAFPQVEGLPQLEAGDLVAFLCSGAYGLTFSNVLFLGHPSPAEVLVDKGQVVLVRASAGAEDTLRGQLLPGEAEDLRDG